MDVFEAVVRDHRGFLYQAALNAAHAVGLFGALAPPAAVPEVAARLGVGARRLRALADVLVLEGALARTGAALVAAGPPPPPAPLPPAGWGLLVDVLRQDRPLALPLDDATAPRYHAHLLAVGAAAARALTARLVGPEVRAVLDAGCGAGVYAAACLDARPDLRATLVDAAPVLDAARAHLGPRAARATFVAGDVRAVTLPAAHDLAVLANVVHLHGPADAAAIVRAAAAALRPGGRLVVKDVAVAADRSGPAAALYFALNLALYTETGDVHPMADLCAWLAAAGLEDVRLVELPESPGSLVVAGRRPAGL